MNHPTSLLIDSHGRILRDLRSDASDEAIQEYLKSVVLQKEDRHHIGSPREIPNGVEEANPPLMKKLGVESTALASFYFYNTTDEIDRFVEVVREIQKFFGK